MKISFLQTRTFLLGLLIASALQAAAQQSKTSNAKNFSGLAVSSGIDLYIKQGASEQIVVKGDADVLKDVMIEQRGNQVSIKFKEGSTWKKIFKTQDVKAYVTVKNLTALAASGGSDVVTENTVKGNEIAVSASGGSDLQLDLVYGNVKLSSSGGSDVDLKGSCQNLVVSASGGSDISAFGFTAANAKASASGGADIELNVSKALEANASGGSDISYKGNAVLRKTSSSKSGDVTHID